MTFGFRTRLFAMTLGVLAVSTLVADLYLRRSVDDLLTHRVETDLAARLSLAQSAVLAATPAPDDRAQWNKLAADLGERSQARVSLVRLDGLLLGDSALDWNGLLAAENHATRPEIVAALQSGFGSSVRRSDTVHQRMLYIARPLEARGHPFGVIRLALPLTEVDAAVSLIHQVLLISALVALGVAIVLSGAASHWASRRARHLADAARRMGAGDLDTRTQLDGKDEFALLGRVLDQLAANLSSTLTALRSERDLLGSVLTGMHEGVLLVSPDNRVALINPALREMLMVGADSLGRSVVEVIRDPELNSLLERARTSGTVATGEMEIGGLRPRRLLVQAHLSQGAPAGLLAVFVDVTTLRQLERLRREFVANVSHELRTPVTAICSAVETLQDAARNDPAAVPMFTGIIARHADRLRRLVADLLDISRLESRVYKLNLESIDLAQTVDHVFTAFKQRAAEKGVALISALPAEAPRPLADRQALEQVLTNLIENAIKYCAREDTVTIGVTLDGEKVRVHVTDTGPGIEERHLPRLFERFYRVDEGRARDAGGTGLGLSIVKHLVEAMGGRVDVTSTVGQGSTFSFTLPKAR